MPFAEALLAGTSEAFFFIHREITKITTSVPSARYAVGITHATRLNPDFGGSAYTVGPYCATKASMTCCSVLPCVRRPSICSSAGSAQAWQGPENSPPGCEHPPAVMVQAPHMHLSFIPICFARSETRCAPIGASHKGKAAHAKRIA